MKRINNWSDQEDKLLLQLYDEVNCFQKWKYISKNLEQRGFLKNQIECRERFVNKLNPQLRQDKLENSQLRQLFQYYDQYGPLWSVFQSLIPGRNQNLLKNKFYSTLRSLVRILISTVQKNNTRKTKISSTSLSSKLLVEIYQGKKNFRKFKGFFGSTLKKLNFQIDVEKIDFLQDQLIQELVQKIKEEILKTKTAKRDIKLSKNKQRLNNSTSYGKASNDVEKFHTSPCPTLEAKEIAPQKQCISVMPISNTTTVQNLNANIYFLSSNSFTFFVPIWSTL